MSKEDLESRGSKNRVANHSSSCSTNNNNNDYGKGRRISSRERQWLIPSFVVANVGMFIVVMYINNCQGKCVARFLGRLSFQPLRDNPLFGPSSSTLDKLGALEWTKVVHKHQGWRLISSMWLHAGLIHLLANMLCLVFIGIRLDSAGLEFSGAQGKSKN